LVSWEVRRGGGADDGISGIDGKEVWEAYPEVVFDEPALESASLPIDVVVDFARSVPAMEPAMAPAIKRPATDSSIQKRLECFCFSVTDGARVDLGELPSGLCRSRTLCLLSWLCGDDVSGVPASNPGCDLRTSSGV